MLVPNNLERLRRDGIIPLGSAYPLVHDIKTALEGEETKPGHVRRFFQGEPTILNSPDVRCYSFESVLRIPGLLTYALGFTQFVRDYLEAEPLLYSVNAFWTKPAEKTHPGLQEFHRDKDDSRFLALFIYGTDVLDAAGGPHQYMIGTQNGAERGPVMNLHGPAMFAFFADGRGLHLGLMPKEHERLLLWVRWGVSDPPASYLKDGSMPAPKERILEYPSDPELQKMVRLVVA